MKICKYCGTAFDKRPNSDICFECMPSGLTASQRNTRKKELERKADNGERQEKNKKSYRE